MKFMKRLIINICLSILVLLPTVKVGFCQFETEGLRDVAPPVGLPFNFLFFFLICLIVLFIVGGVVLFWFLRGKRKPKVKKVPVVIRPAWEIAYEQFEKLASLELLVNGQFKEYYSRLSGIVRQYFENRFDIRAPEMTSEEFLWSLDKSHELNLDQKHSLKEFMSSCDIVKFAKYTPRVEEARMSFELAKRVVDETKKEVVA